MAPTIASLISSSESGDRAAADALFAALYAELHRMAESQLRRSGGGVTLGATTLLHEAYLDISRREGSAFPDRGRFMAYAAKVMRGLIVDYARSRATQKRGGAFEIQSLTGDVGAPASDEELVEIGAALEELAAIDPELAEIVDLKFFCGFSHAEIGATRGLSLRTVQRRWDKARVFLHRWLRQASVR